MHHVPAGRPSSISTLSLLMCPARLRIAIFSLCNPGAYLIHDKMNWSKIKREFLLVLWAVQVLQIVRSRVNFGESLYHNMAQKKTLVKYKSFFLHTGQRIRVKFSRKQPENVTQYLTCARVFTEGDCPEATIDFSIGRKNILVNVWKNIIFVLLFLSKFEVRYITD